MKQVIKKKEFLTNEQKQEKMKKERIERQNEILKNRSEGLKEWSKTHKSAELIFDLVMEVLDSTPKRDKKSIVWLLKLLNIVFNNCHTDYLAYENEIDDMDAVFEILREIHDILAQEIGLESYNEFEEMFYKESEPKESKETQKPMQESASNDDDGLPF